MRRLRRYSDFAVPHDTPFVRGLDSGKRDIQAATLSWKAALAGVDVPVAGAVFAWDAVLGAHEAKFCDERGCTGSPERE